jgi:three-Cys-motif partner protein
MTHSSHSWARASKTPTIRAHSQEKHKLLEAYLARYVATLTQNIKIDQLALTVIDGFAGGNVYLDQTGRECAGSPSIITNAIREAERVTNEKRTKKFQIRDDYFFIEQDKEAYHSLELTLKLSEHRERIGNSIHLFNDDFAACSARIIEFVAHPVFQGVTIQNSPQLFSQ